MAKIITLTQSRYSKLLKNIRKLIEQGRERAALTARQKLVRIYWNIGKRISAENLTKNAGYGDSVLEDLSDELEVDLATLKRCVYFFQTYKSATSSTNLTWPHYKYLDP